jgi:hypothetical protein
MTERAYSEDEAADIKKRDRTDEPRWWAYRWNNFSAAIKYANEEPRAQAGEITFNMRDNGEVWTYDLH